jgi:ankyrin repeat protein
MKVSSCLILLSCFIIVTGCKTDNSAAEARQSLRELQTPFSHPAFVQAIIDNDMEKVDLFLAGGIDPGAGMKNSNPLRIAVSEKRNDVVKKLLDHDIDVDPETFAGTPLCIAAAKNYSDIAAMLIGKGAEINYKKGDISPLIVAASMGNVDIVTLFIEKGADVNIQGDAAEYSPLMLAAANGQEDVVKILLAEEDIDPYLVDRGGSTALSYAIVHEQSGTSELLIKDKSFDPKKNGSDNLVLAISRHNMDIAKMLIDAGCDLNGKYGELSLLSWAIVNNYSDGAELLIRSGADIKQADADNKIPLDYALAAKNEVLVNMLSTAAEKLTETSDTTEEPVLSED